MKNIRDIFAETAASSATSDIAATGQRESCTDTAATEQNGVIRRKRFCPACYMNYEVTTNVCPECGTQMQSPMTEDEEAELMEALFYTRS